MNPDKYTSPLPAAVEAIEANIVDLVAENWDEILETVEYLKKRKAENAERKIQSYLDIAEKISNAKENSYSIEDIANSIESWKRNKNIK